MIHGVPSDAGRIGRLDDDVSAQVGHLAAVLSTYRMVLGKRPIQGQCLVADRRDGPLFCECLPSLRQVVRVPRSRPLLCVSVAVTMTWSPTRHPVTASARSTVHRPSWRSVRA